MGAVLPAQLGVRPFIHLRWADGGGGAFIDLEFGIEILV